MGDRPNILVFLSDEHSPLTLGCYGNKIVQTPAMDRLAAEGVTFERAYCQSPVCVPSRLSFLSGLYPWRVGAWNLLSPPPTHRTSLPGYLKEHGYHTATVGKMHFVGEEQHWGFNYRPYGDFLGGAHQPDPIDHAPKLTLQPAGPAEILEEEMQESIVNRLSIDFLRGYDRDEPFCLWVSYNRPHFPLRPPERYWERYYPDLADLPNLGPNFPERLHPWMRHLRKFFGVDTWTEEETRRARAAYYGCVTFVDDKISEVLQTVDDLGLRENTVTIYFSDHGEMSGKHGLWKKNNFYEPSVRVPLIISHPELLPKGTRVEEVVELLDLYPTLAELAGAPVPGGLDGSSLLPLMLGEGTEGRKGYAISEHYAHGVPGPMRMIRRGDWKYILYLGARPSLFNLKEDPNEFCDRIDEPGEAQRVARECERLLREDWDEALVRENFMHVPDAGAWRSPRQNHTPNQYRTPEGNYVDAETFYGDVYLRAED